MHMGRPAYKVNTGCHGSDVAGNTVAAMASGYLIFKDICGGNGLSIINDIRMRILSY
ncbi:hypothetical protein DPMN_047798 [Dreissena polymorpha]|uniref:Uncharacterized protein n=1 Tax=Dreissena polymorpha TaxID=45954 RepID=A0A9D4DA35_DREPO|nr:hypothetical protein DPMN_047798 [Dreissena polymorpha]